MVKITLITGNPKEVDIVSENMTVREFLEEHEVPYGNATTSIDGNPLNTVGLDASFAEHGVTDRAILSCLPNKDNAAKAYIAGSSCVIESGCTKDEILAVKKRHPEYLKMYDGEDLDFAVDINENTPGSINNYGACFGNAETRDGKATITVMVAPDMENVEKVIRDRFGNALVKLTEIERTIKQILPEIRDEEEKIKEMIVRL